MNILNKDYDDYNSNGCAGYAFGLFIIAVVLILAYGRSK